MEKQSIYSSLIERIFFSKFEAGMRKVDFEREEFVNISKELKIDLPKNLGDVIYSFRFRKELPENIRSTAGKNEMWIIRLAGIGKYSFVLIVDKPLVPNESMIATKIPDSTPGVVSKYALSDEQALLAIVRYNRLVDIFTGVTCYSLQNHLRTIVPDLGQVETDELYVGVNKKGVHFVIPVQAKGGTDKLSIVQIEQDFAVCSYKFPSLICRPVAAQFMKDGIIAMFEFEQEENDIGISSEKHYKLVPDEEVTEADLSEYRNRMSE